MSSKKTEMSLEVKALVEVFKANAGKKMSFKEACGLAGVENKTGYLSGVKKALGQDLVIGEKELEVQTTVTKKVNSYTYNE